MCKLLLLTVAGGSQWQQDDNVNSGRHCVEQGRGWDWDGASALAIALFPHSSKLALPRQPNPSFAHHSSFV